MNQIKVLPNLPYEAAWKLPGGATKTEEAAKAIKPGNRTFFFPIFGDLSSSSGTAWLIIGGVALGALFLGYKLANMGSKK